MNGLIQWIIRAVATKVLSDELAVSAPLITQWLVVRSASRLLDSDREACREQWLADLADRKTWLRQITFALGIRRAALVMRHESLFPGESLAYSAAIRAFDIAFSVLIFSLMEPVILVLGLCIWAQCRLLPFTDTVWMNGSEYIEEGKIYFRTRDAKGNYTKIGKLIDRLDIAWVPSLILVVNGKAALGGRYSRIMRADGKEFDETDIGVKPIPTNVLTERWLARRSGVLFAYRFDHEPDQNSNESVLERFADYSMFVMRLLLSKNRRQLNPRENGA
jgi:hypothetical protein